MRRAGAICLVLVTTCSIALAVEAIAEARDAKSRYESVRRARKLQALAGSPASETEGVIARGRLASLLDESGIDPEELAEDVEGAGIGPWAVRVARSARELSDGFDEEGRARLIDLAERLEALGRKVSATRARQGRSPEGRPRQGGATSG